MKLSKTIIAVLLSVLIVLPMLACTASTGTQTQTPATSASTQASTSTSTSTAPTQASTSSASKLPASLVVAVSGEILNIDPQVAGETTSEIIRQHMYDFLVNMNLKGEIEPSLAKSWETSADGKTWTFHLRNDVKFHDGTPFNAQAVKTTFDRIINKQYGATVSYDFEMLTAANVVDDYTVQLVTSIRQVIS